MKNNRTISYLALLSVPFLALGMALSLNPAQARVEGGTTVINTVIRPTSDGGYSSNCLVNGGQTVLLGQLQTGQSVAVDLTLNGAEAAAHQLTVSGQSEYLTVTVEEHTDSDAAFTVIFTAANVFLEQMTENVTITWGDLSATFRLELDPPPKQSGEIPLSGQTELTTENTEGNGTEEEQPTESTEPTTPPSITLTAPSVFALDRLLPVKLTVTGSAETVTIESFAPLTRYSTDGGKSWYQLYHGGAVELAPAEVQLLLLDFSRTAMEADEVLSLYASADGVILTEDHTVTACEPVPQPAAVPILWLPTTEEQAALDGYLNPTTVPVESQSEAQNAGETTLPTETTQPAGSETPAPQTETEQETTTEPTQFVLETLPESGIFENDYFVVPLPAGWDQRVYILERLEQKDGNRAYTPVEDQSVLLRETVDALVVTLGTTPPKAGTYRLTIQHMFEGVCAEQMQMTFFINYSTRSDAQQKEVPDNE